MPGASSTRSWIHCLGQLALSVLARASRDLLRRTAELPDTEQGLLLALTEYRHAVYAFAEAADKLQSSTKTFPRYRPYF